ncbi:DUF4166 domain-containing protein [Ornithinibacillus halophilus]|uniref:DUF4166 domain-containing protein n=1 Tax=Ornithinibacillus halophilus TaxID=930117 RepID=A0A1M5FJG4_9BACI|nr:DUF4166 domain-containing protein [Ornithinibacillus halophilus]SHF91663.1 protein of unknown function [Ornithinibacillus halophilus]
MTIYKQMLGNDYYKLHPMLQKRYLIDEGSSFHGKGIMTEIRNGPKWLKPFFKIAARRKFLFPEEGTNIPFTISNTYRTDEHGEEQVYWERIFYIEEKVRFFNATMSFDAKRKIVKDYLGEPPLFYSDLMFRVVDESLIIESKKQRLILGSVEIPLPKFFQGITSVKESYENGEYIIHVQVSNPLIGRLFTYKGAFVES